MSKKLLDTTDDWKKWQSEFAPAPTELWTRAEILATAKRLGARRPDGKPVDDRTLRFWEENGVIPRGIEGKLSARGYTYRLYPWWVVDLLHQVCRYQIPHVKLEELPPRMRVEAQYLSLHHLWERPKDPRAYADNKLSSYIFRMLREPTLPPFSRPIDGGVNKMGRQVSDALRELALSLQWVGLDRAARARVEFFDEEDQAVATYDADLREYQRTPEQQAGLDRLREEMARIAVSPAESSTSE